MTDLPTENKHLRRIRSFALRTGRMTEGQQRAYEANQLKFGLSVKDGVLDQQAVFGRTAPLVFEIGFGMGQSLAAMAAAEPDKDFVGVEVHTPGVAKLMMLCEEQGINNVRIYEHDALEVLEKCIPKASIDRLQLYFPDPWHKTKHHKRRIVRAEFMELLLKHLKPEGLVHFATDWQNYAEHMLKVTRQYPQFTNLDTESGFSPRPAWRPETKFERRGVRLGHGVWDILLTAP